MSSRGGRRGGRGRHAHAVSHENEERWLLTYADMITLLMALFMVLFSISSVNVSKYQILQQSLKSAFSGSVLTGGRSILQTGSSSTSSHTPSTADGPAIVPLTANSTKPRDTTAAEISTAEMSVSAADAEQQSFQHLQAKLNAYARAHGFSNQVHAFITRQGLDVRVLTDHLLFGSGSATLVATGFPLLDEVGRLLKIEGNHPIMVEGNTDNVPISTSQFPSNWELSTDRATAVVRYLIAQGVPEHQLGAAGYAALHPVATNTTATGRALNRRVDIVIQRLYPDPSN
jgi:chemotaxis protein MotB